MYPAFSSRVAKQLHGCSVVIVIPMETTTQSGCLAGAFSRRRDLFKRRRCATLIPSNARAVTQFLVQLVADGAVITSNAISQTIALKRWRR